jgi:hypothetical protein
MQVFPNMSYVNYGNAAGEFVGVGREAHGDLYIELIDSTDLGKYRRYVLDSQGNRGRLLQIVPYNPVKDDWYTDAARAGKPVWSDIYQWGDRPEIFSISSSYPVYD